jgi:phosphatidylinositol glycan class A protein
MVGDGPKLKPLREMVRQRQLEGRIILHGGKSNCETLSIIKQCNIFLSTALTESFGIALVEAASLGLHVVSTNVGGVSEILPAPQLHTVELEQGKII